MRTVTKRCFYIHIISSLHVPFLCLINLQCTRNISLSVKNTLLSMCPEFWGQPCWPIKRRGIPVGIFYCGWFFDTCQQHMSCYWNIIEVRGSHVLIVLSSIISPDGADDKESEVDVELMWIWSLKNDTDSQEGGHAWKYQTRSS